MKIAMLAKATGWHFQDFLRACHQSEQTHRVVALDFSGLATRFGASDNVITCDDQILNQFDVVLPRAMPAGSLEQIIFRMDLLGQLQQSGVVVLNQPRAIEISVDKYLSLMLLKRAGLPVPSTVVVQSEAQAIAGFDWLGGNAVLKPIFGSEGRGLVHVQSTRQLREACSVMETGAVFYLQQYIEHDHRDLRLLVVGDDVWGMQRRNQNHWILNASLGAECSSHSPSDGEVSWAKQAANAVEAEFAGVDLIYDRSGEPYLIEVNAAPGWRHLSRACGVDVAARLLTFVANLRERVP